MSPTILTGGLAGKPPGFMLTGGLGELGVDNGVTFIVAAIAEPGEADVPDPALASAADI